MHRLLKRQLKRLYGKSFDFNQLSDREKQLIDIVALTYKDNDKERRFYEHTLDISSKELTEKNRALNKILASFSEAQRLAEIGSWTLDLRHDVLEWSDELYRILGLEPKAIEPSMAHISDLIHPNDREAANFSLRRIQEADFSDSTYRLQFDTGIVKYIHEHRETIHDRNGIPIVIQGTIQNVTEHKELEEKLHQAQKMEAIGTLVGGIAHDFNNMLAGMTGNLYLAKKKVRDNPDLTQKLANIERLSFRAADMIEQLLTFARKSIISMKPLALTPFIKETLKLLHLSVPENINITQKICTDPLSIKGDTTQLHQVLMNLLNNARDAVEEVDEPHVTVRLEPFQPDDTCIIDHAYFKAGKYAHLSVEDNGCGIPEHQIKHLFEPFFTTKEQGKGTGLGLSMVFGSVKTHHGFIEVKSSEGKGSVFHIYIPLLKEKGVVSLSSKKSKALD